MEGNADQPSFLQSVYKDETKNIHLFPVCKTGRTKSFPSSIKLGTPLKKKRSDESPDEGTPNSRRRFFSPDFNVQHELLEMFTNDSEIIPTKADLLNMDLMSDTSMFTNEAEIPSVKVSKCQSESLDSVIQHSEKVVGDDVPVNRIENNCQTPRTPANEALAHTAIIELIKEAVKSAMLPLKEEISFLRATVMKQNEKVLPQKKQGYSPSIPSSNGNTFPQIRQEQFVNTGTREKAPNSRYLNSPSYNAMSNNWGLPNQGRHAKSYSETLSRNCAAIDSSVPNLQPTPQMRIQEIKNPAFELARRCMGFHPITSEDIGKIGGFHEDNENEEQNFQSDGKDSIRKFLHYEMNMSVRCVDDLRIKNVFYPPVGAVSRTLFCEFFSEEEAAYVRKSAKNLKTVNGYRSKIVDFVPRSLEDRHKAVECEAYKIRQNNLDLATGKSNVSTRIWLTTDIELRVRKKGDPTPWGRIDKVVLKDLPVQAPKRSWPRSDLLNKRRPETPRIFPSNKSPAHKSPIKLSSSQLKIQNIYTVLDDDCQE